ncbi:hypothetical protein L3X38_043435 [Prunus dulcis]|uniref:Uncharacterized protein n=1 Tax=Prunus dulcis TaxID=3755 RepID=A0AAD4YMH2_PRUDU|nr:hypothetical protein L3X38_043435 [Prunus dulcis]
MSNEIHKVGLSVKTSAPAVVLPSSHNHAEKPEKFNGIDFKRWQQKTLFYITTLNLAHILKADPLAPGDTTETVAASDAWNQSDFLCRNYNGLSDALYNVYSPIQTAKAL